MHQAGECGWSLLVQSKDKGRREEASRGAEAAWKGEMGEEGLQREGGRVQK